MSDLVQVTPEGTPLEQALAQGAQNLRSAVARWVSGRSQGSSPAPV